MSRKSLKQKWSKLALLSALGALSFAGLQVPVQASTAQDLLKILRAKHIVTEEEYKSLAEDLEAEEAQEKSERRKAKLKEAMADEAREKQKEEAKTAIKTSFKDGITWESADKSTSLALNGRIQLDYRNYGGNDAIDANTFDVRRAYLSGKGTFYDAFSFLVQADFAQNGVALDEGWLNVAWWKPVQFRFGQFKMPMSLEELTSDLHIDFQERSLVNGQIPGKERGAMIHGEPFPGVYYGLALSTGQGKNNNEGNNIVDSNDVIGRVAVNFANIFDYKKAVFHVGGAFSDGTIPVAALTSGRTEGRGITFFNTAAFTGNDVDRQRKAFETAIAYGPVKFQAEYVNVNFDGRSTAGVNYDRDIDVYYTSLSWLITGENYADSYSGGIFGRIRPKMNFKPGSGGFGALEAAVRYSNFDASDFKTTNVVGTGVLAASGQTTTPTNKAESWTLGLKWIPNPNTKLYLNYIDTKFGSPVTITPGAPGVPAATSNERAVTLRFGFDF